MTETLATARRVLEIESKALSFLARNIGKSFETAVNRIHDCKGRVVTCGMGKSGIVAKKIAATLSSTGTPSFFMHPSEALHGDLGMLREGDILLALSNSGSTEEIVLLIPALKRLGVFCIGVSGKDGSPISSLCDLHIHLSVEEEACPIGLAPMTSTTAQMAIGDALAACLMEKRGFKEEDFARLHPGGKLGKSLMRVEELMHKDEAVPVVLSSTPMKDSLIEISRKKLGMTAVVDENSNLVGIITDGDLKRLLEKHGASLLSMASGDCAVKNPVTIEKSVLCSVALKKMEDRRITSIIVADENKKVLGVIHIHDLWGLQLF